MINKKTTAFRLAALACMLISPTALANSSWHWLTKAPVDLMPFAVILTLLIEIVAIWKANDIASLPRVITTVTVANLLSFLLPYAMLLMPSEMGYTFQMSTHNLPTYTIGLGYLFLTLVVELPVVYLLLKKTASDKWKLLLSIVLVNILTTALVFVLERVFCPGAW